jgi:predicted ATP-grasp superfamily ATP-dependent carboligase
MAAAYAMVRPPSSVFGDPFAAHEDYTAEDEARYEENLAATREAVAEADALNGMLEAQNLHVVIAQDSKVIDRRIKEITKNAKQLGPNEAAIPTAIEQVVGELIQLHNAIVKFPDGQSLKEVRR